MCAAHSAWCRDEARNTLKMLEQLTHEYFQALLGRKFSVSMGSTVLELQLASCRDIPSPLRDKAERQAFSLIFHGPLQPVLPQRIHKLEGGPEGPLEIFLVPVGPDQQSMRYEAIFT
jgi:hypothetical protein